MTATMTDNCISNKDALTILREIDLQSRYRLTVGIYEGECKISGICYEKDSNFFLNIDTDIDIKDEINATLAINNIIISGLVAPTGDDNNTVLLAHSLRYQIRTHPRIQNPKLTIKFNGLSPLMLNDVSVKGLGITVNVDDYSKFTDVKECTLSLDKEHVKLECELINSHYLGNGQARLGWIILNPTQKLQHLLTKNSTNL